MAVVLGPQAEVAQVLPVVPGLHQGAEHHHGHGGLLRLAPGSVQQLLEGGAVGLLQVVAQGGHHGAQGLGLVGGGLLVDPVDAGLVQLVQVLRHALVGRQHEGLDQGLADPLAVHRHVHRRAALVADHIALLGVQLQGAPPAPAALQHLGQGGHVLQHGQDVLIPLRQRRVAVGEQHVAVLVGHTLGGADHALGDGVLHHLPLRRQGHDAGQGQPVCPGIEGADAVGQLLWQHGHHLVGEVHRRAPLPGLQIQGGALGDVVAHVGDVHPQHPAAPAVLLQAHRVVQILGGGPVDGDDGLVPEIQPPGLGGFLHRLGGGHGLGQHRVGEVPADVVLIEDGGHGALPLPGGAEHLPQGAHGGQLGTAEAGHGHGGPIPRPDIAALGEHLDGAGQLVIVRLEPQLPVVSGQDAGDRLVGPPGDGGDPGGAAAALPLLLQGLYAHLVAVPRAPVGAGRDEPVVLPALSVLRRHKAEAPAGGLIDAGDLTGLLVSHMKHPFRSLSVFPIVPQKSVRAYKKRPSGRKGAFVFRVTAGTSQR